MSITEQPDSALRDLALWEIASIVTSCLAAEWVVLALLNDQRWFLAIPLALALGLMLYSHRLHGESFAELGFRLDNIVPALKILSIPTLTAIIFIVIAGKLTSTGPVASPLRARFLL